MIISALKSRSGYRQFSADYYTFSSVQPIPPLYNEKIEADPQEHRADLQLKSRPASLWSPAPVIPKPACSWKSPGGLVRIQPSWNHLPLKLNMRMLGPIFMESLSQKLKGGAREYAFLMSFQVMLIHGPHFENLCSRPSMFLNHNVCQGMWI